MPLLKQRKTQLATPQDSFFIDTPAASLQWVGRLRWSTHTYELVRAPQGEVVMASKHARFGVERIDAEQLPGWVDDAS